MSNSKAEKNSSTEVVAGTCKQYWGSSTMDEAFDQAGADMDKEFADQDEPDFGGSYLQDDPSSRARNYMEYDDGDGADEPKKKKKKGKGKGLYGGGQHDAGDTSWQDGDGDGTDMWDDGTGDAAENVSDEEPDLGTGHKGKGKGRKGKLLKGKDKGKHSLFAEKLAKSVGARVPDSEECRPAKRARDTASSLQAIEAEFARLEANTKANEAAAATGGGHVAATGKWERRESRSTPGHFYFYNPTTGESCQEPPPPWEQRESRSNPGVSYFYNPETGESLF